MESVNFKRTIQVIFSAALAVLAFVLTRRVALEYLEGLQTFSRNTLHLVTVSLAVGAGALVFLFLCGLREGLYRWIWIAAFASYLAVVVYLLFFKASYRHIGPPGISEIFYEFWRVFKTWRTADWAELRDNFLAFLPLPFFFWGIKLKMPHWLMVAVFVLIEVLQELVRVGAFDLVDLIAYIAAYFTGSLFVWLYGTLVHEPERRKRRRKI